MPNALVKCILAVPILAVLVLSRTSAVSQERPRASVDIEFTDPMPVAVPVRSITIQGDAAGQLVIEDGVVAPVQVVQPVPGQLSVIPNQPASAQPAPSRRSGKPKLVQPLPKEYTARDKNGDGQIGMYEWDRSKYAEFTKLDKNGDGFLTAQELAAKGKSVQSRVRLGADAEALPNPGSLTAYNQKIGESFTFSVTGQAGGSIWGTGTFTTDSSLATAAVHAGVLKDGEAGTVRVTIVQSPSQFTASTTNGVSSGPWSSFPAAYTVSR